MKTDSRGPKRITVAGLEVEVVNKAVRRINIRIYPPHGRVRVTAPHHTSDEALRSVLLKRLHLIEKHQKQIIESAEPPVQLTTGAGLKVWGQQYLLEVRHSVQRPTVRLDGDTLVLVAPPNASAPEVAEILDAWYRDNLQAALPDLVELWSKRLGVGPTRISVRKMRTRWGSCTPKTGAIRIGLELAKHPPRCLEYVVVHELAHLIVPGHGPRFYAVMDQHLPSWRLISRELKAAPLPGGTDDGDHRL